MLASPDTFRFILQIAAVFLGGGAVQLIIALLRRRSELRELDTKADATLLASAQELITALQGDLEVQRRIVAELRKEVDQLRWRLGETHREHTRVLERERLNGARLENDLARVRSDLAVAQAQIARIAGQ